MMKWSIFELQKYRNEKVLLDETINMDELKDIDETIREVSPIKVTGDVHIGTNKYTFNLHITGHLILPCSRTLVDVHYPIDIKTMETFFNIRLDERQQFDDSADDDVNYVEGNTIDLLPIVKELLILEIPMQVYSETTDPNEGAPQSGDGWEVIDEIQIEKKVDPRLADLANFFKKDNEEK